MRGINILYVILVLLSYNGGGVFAQKDLAQSVGENFQSLSFLELQKLENVALENEDWKYLNQLAGFHLKKAKAKKNDLETARAFYYLATMAEPLVALKYADSIIDVTEKSLHSSYPAQGFALKGHIYYEMGDFQPALNEYLKAHKFALKKDNVEQQREISLAIAAIRNINGQHYAAAELYEETLRTLKKSKNFANDFYDDYLLLLYNLSLTHLRLQQLDYAKEYVSEGLEVVLSNQDKINLKDFTLLDAQINYYGKDFRKAKDTLEKYVESLEGTSKAIKLYYLGKIENQYGNTDLAAQYFLKIDSIVSATKDPFNEVKDVYQQLIINSILKDDKRKQIEYISKLINYDSILSTRQENIINKAMISYDIPYLKYQKRKAEEQLKAKSKYLAFSGLMATFGVFSGVFFYYRSRRMKSRLNLLIKGGPQKSITNSAPLKHPASLPEDIRNDLLQKLEKFENSDGFLDKDLDLATLAQMLGTNTSYLSLVINHYKKMTFPKYLKDLRIIAAIGGLNKDPQLLKYNYQGLAELFGFKTGESFSKAFYEKTGVYPSKFLNELKSRKNNT